VRRLLGRLVVAAAVAAVAAGLWFRLVPDDPARWAADPLTAARTGKPNDFLMAPPGGAGDAESPVFALPAAALMARLEAVAATEPRTRLVARGADGLSATWVQRSAVWGFPDYVSARVVDLGGDASALAIWSRARFGHSDLGVNRARVERWTAALRDG
jgi:hypothetical protein